VDKAVVKLFGLNRLNFWGWLVTGILLAAVAGYLGVRAAKSITLVPQELRPLMDVLGAIAFLLLGILGVLLQMYFAMYAEKLEKQSVESAYSDPTASRQTPTGIQSPPFGGH
jgi:hypothetical protein